MRRMSSESTAYCAIVSCSLSMLDEIKKNHSLVRVLIILLIFAVGGYVVSLAWIVISQFLDLFVILLSAWLLSFILEPIVEKMEGLLKISKLVSTIITYMLISALLVAITIGYIPLATSQISTITNSLHLYLQSAPSFIVDFSNSLSNQLSKSVTVIPSVAQFLFLAFITLILSFYFIVDREKINREFFKLMPKQWHNVLRFTQKVINDTFISFLKIQLFFGISSGIVTWIILIAFHIDFAASIAFVSGAFAFIPLIGSLLALIPPILVAFLIDPVKAFIIGAMLLIMQQIIFNIIGPKLLGKAFKLHPAIILVSFLVGLQFAGAIGATFAIPVLGISAVMIRRFGDYFIRVKDETIKK